ncbi:MAG TPA: type I DNA topoisomerase [Planctomycetota bacterium]|jgi:DNA topoisomerase-1|nr:type I DNA topoisomerase [Planctomycetota bacterium]
MAKSLVIVESPAKARTITKFLGSGYVVKASFGHVRDLPKGKFGIDLEDNFKPQWGPIPGRQKILAELKAAASKADKVFLAPDPDREGEAIAWHLAEALELPKAKAFRVHFNEITAKAVKEAFADPGKIRRALVDAQLARRILDRIVGYKLSPLLWKKIAKGLSAGRVQSVAVRMIVEREREVRAFKPQVYWKVAALFREADGKEWKAGLSRVDGETAGELDSEERANAVVARLAGKPLAVRTVEKNRKSIRALPPFTTSLLQQQASIRLRFSAKKTMRVAQQLYEGIEIGADGSVGLITYMRTDSYRVSNDALGEVRPLILEAFGADYLPAEPNRFQARKGAQEAHEAIRPTSARCTPDSIASYLDPDQLKLYRLIWERFVASQMTPARYDLTTATLEAEGCEFVGRGRVLVFDGHTRLLGALEEEQALPPLEPGQVVMPQRVEATRHETQPPPRYSEATLVKALEKKGIGRPSTYASILSTIQDRGYVDLRERKFFATELGEVVTGELVEHFGRVINEDFTSHLEADLDRIEAEKAKWKDVVKAFYRTFEKDLRKAKEGMKDFKRAPQVTDQVCEKCGAPMVALYHKKGKFLGCSRYPECENRKSLGADGTPKQPPVPTEHKCPKCGAPMLLRNGRRGPFLACSAFPKCRSTVSADEQGNPVRPKETGIACEKCGAPMVVKTGRRGPFLACSAFPKCRNAKPLPEELREAPKDAGVACERCGAPMVVRSNRWGKEFVSCSTYPKCKNARNLAPAGAVAGAEGAGEREEGPASDEP